jgi:hypothetical protein
MNNINSINSNFTYYDYFKSNKRDNQEINFIDTISKESVNAKEKETHNIKSETKSTIVVKPDGSRVLMINTKVGNMVTSMSIKLTDENKLDDGMKNQPEDVMERESDLEDNETKVISDVLE